MLVMNNEGIPLSFKCTEAIKPTAIQRSLYGEKMELHIVTKLCVLPLIQAIKNELEILFVNEQSFLAIREETVIPTLFIQQIENVSYDSQSLVLKSHSEYESDKKDIFDESIRQSCRFDFIEPFDRIKKAVAILGKNDARFQ